MSSPTVPPRAAPLRPPEPLSLPPPVVAHPRIRARRIEVRRDEGRRRLRRILALAVVVVLAGGAAGSTRTALLDVDRISVVGASRTGADAVVDATGVSPADPMTDVDSSAVAARVTALPWVDRASVQRLWPATLRIRVVERRPVAQFLTRDGVVLTDSTGRLLAHRSRPLPGLVAIEGFEPGRAGDRLAAARPALAVVAALPPDLADEVAAIRPVPGGLEVVLTRGIVVRLGPATALDDKLLALAALLDGADLGEVAVIDVRVPRAPVTLTSGREGA